MAEHTTDPTHQRHRAAAPDVLQAVVITVSDSRTHATDVSGRLMVDLLAAAGHQVRARELLPDEPAQVRRRVEDLCQAGDLDLILINGGTGIGRRDSTYEAVIGLLQKTLPGFGELFRALSYQEIGAAALASRAVGGVRGRTLIFSTPGSPAAVRLAMAQLIIPEAPHLAGELRRGGGVSGAGGPPAPPPAPAPGD
jgi:molybdenum cofactor biosynthesis protein B